jgi:hypothetical protein
MSSSLTELRCNVPQPPSFELKLAPEHVDLHHPRMTGTEAEVNWSMLNHGRSVLSSKCHNLDDEQLKLRTVSPGKLTLLGLLRRMSKVEHPWFQR